MDMDKPWLLLKRIIRRKAGVNLRVKVMDRARARARGKDKGKDMDLKGV